MPNEHWIPNHFGPLVPVLQSTLLSQHKEQDIVTNSFDELLDIANTLPSMLDLDVFPYICDEPNDATKDTNSG